MIEEPSGMGDRGQCARCLHAHQDGDPCGLPILFYEEDGRIAGKSRCDCPTFHRDPGPVWTPYRSTPPESDGMGVVIVDNLTETIWAAPGGTPLPIGDDWRQVQAT